MARGLLPTKEVLPRDPGPPRHGEAMYPRAAEFSRMKLQGAESPPEDRTHPALRAPLRGGDHHNRSPLGKGPLSGGVPEGRGGFCLSGGVAESRGESSVEPEDAVSGELRARADDGRRTIPCRTRAFQPLPGALKTGHVG